MPENLIPVDQTLTSSPAAERDSSRSLIEGKATVPQEPASCGRKTRGKKVKIRDRKGKDGTMALDSSVEGESHELPSETMIVPCEPHNSLAVNQIHEPPIGGMSIVPHDTEGTNGPTSCRKGKKRGRHFDREVRAKILYVCLSLFLPPIVLLYAVV
jgi:snRNA-activating protein complex subunit 3